MNRLVLVGNGFDLSHNLKTSYSDFIFDYLLNALKTFNGNGIYSDLLFEIKSKFAGHKPGIEIPLTNAKIIELIKSFNKSQYIECQFKSRLLKRTVFRIHNTNWVDLENLYFEMLLESKYDSKFVLQKVDELNEEFSFIKFKLEEYLTKIQNESEIAINPDYIDIITGFINSNEIVTKQIRDQLPDNILLLNFNYTPLLEKYTEEFNKRIYTEINYIHGQLNSTANPIIFGFGDEYNKHYLEFESLNEKKLFAHIKSFEYFKTTNYHNLIRFIDSGDYQVYVIGHSLGLSDRTMLKTIFEHDYCKSIKVFFHQKSATKNDYTEKTYDISNHISDKSLLRKKVVPFTFSKPMPSKIEGKSL